MAHSREAACESHEIGNLDIFAVRLSANIDATSVRPSCVLKSPGAATGFLHTLLTAL